MNRTNHIFTFLLTIFAFTFASQTFAMNDNQKMKIMVTLLPMKSMVEAIGKEHVTVSVMVPQGTHPNTFEPSPSQMVALSSASLYINMGIPHEQNWLPQVKAARPDMPIISFMDAVDTRKKDGKDITDPHIWLGPQQLRDMATSLRDTLVKLDPDNGADFIENTDTWIDQLNIADAQAKVRLEPYKGRAFLVFHPAFGYLSDYYGIRQIAIQNQGMEPGPRRIASSIEIARSENIHTIFVQESFSQDEAKTIANEINGELVVLNPLAGNLIDNITNISTAIEASFK